MPLVLGVDSSPRATKVELRDSESGELFGSGRADHPAADREWSESTGTSRSEQDPRIWWQGVIDARRDAGGALGVSSVAVAAQPHAMVALDHAGHAVRAAKLSDDTEAKAEAQSLVDALKGPGPWANACGSVPRASFSIARLAWLKHHDAGAFARVEHVLSAHDWLTLRLGGRAATDRGDASTSGYFSPRENRWCPELLSLVDADKEWSACLPAVLNAGEPAGERERVVIATGTASCMATALAVGLRPRTVTASFDEGWVCAVRDRPTEDPSGAVSGFADATGRYLPSVSRPSARGLIEAFSRSLGVDSSRFERLALDGKAGAGGLVFVPALRTGPGAGARSGTLIGVNDEMGPDVIARAVVEGIANAMLDDIDALRGVDVPASGRIVLVGDGRMQAIARVLADLGERPVGVSQGSAAVRGACALAAAALDGRSAADIVAAWGIERVREYEPDPYIDGADLRARYRTARAHLYES